LVFFTQTLNCETCGITKQLLDEIIPLSSNLQLQTYNFAIDQDAVAQYAIPRIPAIAVVRLEAIASDGGTETRERDYGIRFYGVPAGYEFAALLGAIQDVSSGESGLQAGSKAALAQLATPVHFQVFTTPT
jgi:hypothetical protein